MLKYFNGFRTVIYLSRSSDFHFGETKKKQCDWK